MRKTIILTTILFFIFLITAFEVVYFYKNKIMEKNDIRSITVGLVDPEMAPKDILSQVMRGYQIMRFTDLALPENVKADLSCSNCHFAAGNTLGGKRGGISLVGTINTYPKFSERVNKEIDLRERINECFERSMNGIPLKVDSKDMDSIIAYLKWISKDIPTEKSYPWLGLKALKSNHVPEGDMGEKIYQKNCALCHGNNGEGSRHNPPLWGKHAYNEGAGMSKLPKLSSFIFYNMPFDDPFLTENQALDVAEFLINKRRPSIKN